MVDPHGHLSGGRRRASSVGSRSADHLGAIGEDPGEDGERDSDTETIASQNTEHNREPGFSTRPYWIDDADLRKGAVEELSTQEEVFWKELLEKYLYPIDENKDEKVGRGVIFLPGDFGRGCVRFNFLLLLRVVEWEESRMIVPARNLERICFSFFGKRKLDFCILLVGKYLDTVLQV